MMLCGDHEAETFRLCSNLLKWENIFFPTCITVCSIIGGGACGQVQSHSLELGSGRDAVD
jgi:hypothetical protein